MNNSKTHTNNLPTLLKTWDNETLKNTLHNYSNALTHYRGKERKAPHYKTMVKRIELIENEIWNRYIDTIEPIK